MTYRIRCDSNSSHAAALHDARQRELEAERAKLDRKARTGVAVGRAKLAVHERATNGEGKLCDRETALAAAKRAVQQQTADNIHAKEKKLLQKICNFEHMKAEDLLISPRPRLL